MENLANSDAVGCGFDPRRAHHILERKIDTRDLRSFNCQKHKTTFCEYNKKSANYFAVFLLLNLIFYYTDSRSILSATKAINSPLVGFSLWL